jgi:CBS domain-containing protein
MKLRDVLNLKDFKNRAVISIGPDETISAAIEKLIDYDKGALAVPDDKGELMGIITERDIVRKALQKIEAFRTMKVHEVMTPRVIIGQLDDEVEYAISVMKQKNIRHLPILDGQKVIGIISMRDLLGLQLDECAAKIRYAPLIPRTRRTGRLV